MGIRTISPLQILLLAALGGCASTAEEVAEETAAEGQRSNDCIFVSTIEDFRVLDDRNLIIYAPSRRSAYHVQLALRCSALRFTDRIGVSSRDGRLCGYGGDAIIVDEQPSARRCTVDRVSALAPGERDALLARYGKLGEEAVAPAEPEESVEAPAEPEAPSEPQAPEQPAQQDR